MDYKNIASIRAALCALRLKAFREEKGMTIREMARIVKCSPTTISNYESGARIPTVDFVDTVASRFNLSFEWLSGGNVQNDVAKLINIYNSLNELGKNELTRYAVYLSERGDLNGD